MKVQVSLNDKLMERVDSYVKENYLSRSGLVSVALAQYLNQAEMMGLVKELALAMRKIADTGVVDKDVENQLRDYERLAKMMVGI